MAQLLGGPPACPSTLGPTLLQMAPRACPTPPPPPPPAPPQTTLSAALGARVAR